MSIRQLASPISTGLFAFLLCMAIATFGIVAVLSSPTKMKGVVAQSGLYEDLVSGILAQSQQQAPSLADPINTIPLNQPGIQTAIQTAFPPQLVQSQVEPMIDSIYVWLQGKIDVPDFKINLTKPKDDFALAMGSYIQQRLAALPACTTDISPDTLNLFETSCVPAGFDINAAAQTVELEVAASNQFLPDPVLTAGSFTSSSGQPLFVQLHNLPGYYQTGVSLPYIFAVLAFFAMLFSLASSLDKRKAMHRIAAIITFGGVFFVVAAWLFNTLFQHFTSSLNGQGDNIITQGFSVIITQTDQAINHEYVILGFACAGIGAVLLTAIRLLPSRFMPSTPVSSISGEAYTPRISK